MLTVLLVAALDVLVSVALLSYRDSRLNKRL